MDYIENDRRTKRHAMLERRGQQPNGMTEGKTWCGLITVGHVGACIASLIDCERCKRSMRSEGWTV